MVRVRQAHCVKKVLRFDRSPRPDRERNQADKVSKHSNDDLKESDHGCDHAQRIENASSLPGGADPIFAEHNWVLLVMGVCTRRLVGFGVERAAIDGVSVCRMFNRAIAGQQLPQHLSFDQDPLFRFHRWLANLRVLAIEEVKSVPYAPVSHPFIERLIGTIRREYLDRASFWTSMDLTRKLAEFQDYYNAHRVHRSLAGETPAQIAGAPSPLVLRLITTLGGSIVVDCSRPRSPLTHQFATHTARITRSLPPGADARRHRNCRPTSFRRDCRPSKTPRRRTIRRASS